MERNQKLWTTPTPSLPNVPSKVDTSCKRAYSKLDKRTQQALHETFSTLRTGLLHMPE